MPHVSPIARIGRPANPAERGYQLVVEHPEVLDRVGRNLLGATYRLTGRSLDEAWALLADDEREGWLTEALVRLQEHVRDYKPSQAPDPDPEPGQRGSLLTSAFSKQLRIA